MIAKTFSRFFIVVGLLFVFCISLFGERPDSLASPVPKVVKLDVKDKDYLRILGGPPETSTMRSGLVVLAPGKSVGKHSTEQYEELVIPLEGKGERYVYVLAKTSGKERPK